MYELKKMERYLRVNLLGPGPRLMKKEFTGPRSHKVREKMVYRTVLLCMEHSTCHGHTNAHTVPWLSVKMVHIPTLHYKLTFCVVFFGILVEPPPVRNNFDRQRWDDNMKIVAKYVEEMRTGFEWLKTEAEWPTDRCTSNSFPFLVSKVDVSADKFCPNTQQLKIAKTLPNFVTNT